MEEHCDTGTTAHFGRVFDICGEKNHHLPPGTPGRKYKGHAVYPGNHVRARQFNWSIFPEFAPCPSTVSASKVTDFHSLLERHHGEQADTEMENTQTDFKGPETWEEFPPEQWPAT